MRILGSYAALLSQRSLRLIQEGVIVSYHGCIALTSGDVQRPSLTRIMKITDQ